MPDAQQATGLLPKSTELQESCVQWLDVRGNLLESLDPLQAYRRLQSLTLQRNRLTGLVQVVTAPPFLTSIFSTALITDVY